MIKLVSIVVLTPLITTLLFGCREHHERDITGWYGQDKFVLRDTSRKVNEQRFLAIRSNHTFALKGIFDGDSVTGNWKIVEAIDNEKSLVQFALFNRKIQVQLQGNIFYFEHPDDFHSGYYESVLYVKLSRPPDGLK